jgi:phenylalanyl-tRNA synthetase alpha chain
MSETIEDVESQFQTDLAAAVSLEAVKELRDKYLGRKNGKVTFAAKQIASQTDKAAFGAKVNRIKSAIETALTDLETRLADSASVLARPIDTTVPGIPPQNGGLHPTIQMMYDLNDAFAALNFEVFEGPEITSELYEFDHMNFPPDHPARESMDTYWLASAETDRGADRLCIRPHLTGASVRYMQRHKPPFRFVYPGRRTRLRDRHGVRHL